MKMYRNTLMGYFSRLEESCVLYDFLGDIGQGLLHIANEVISVDCEVVALVSAEGFLKKQKNQE